MRKHYLFKSENLSGWAPMFDDSFVLNEYKTPMGKNYLFTLMGKNRINFETLKKLYNKLEVKLFFEKHGLNIPKLYHYTNKNENIEKYLKEKYVAKPAHMSESDGVFINEKDFTKVNKVLNELLNKGPQLKEPDMMKQTERGILIEEFIECDYEFKVFVLYGCPIVGDLRAGSKEYNRVDMISLENKYFDWSNEYEICKNIAKELKIDFFRIDFFYNKKENKLYAGEMAFRPSTLLGEDIENYIYINWLKIKNK
jgi:glutathione synthase/RimK-type ligase-like ATP-grasp enzyme